MNARALLKARVGASAVFAWLVIGLNPGARGAINRQEWKNPQSFDVSAAKLVKLSPTT
ncbi:MAG: hypothetical protein ABIV50_15595 [Opitutus sp.]